MPVKTRKRAGLLAFLAFLTFFAASDLPSEQIKALAAFQQFADTKPFLIERADPASAQVYEACANLNRRCVEFAALRKDLLERAIPDNPESWRAYEGLLDAGPLPIDAISWQGPVNYSRVIEAVTGWNHCEPVGHVVNECQLRLATSTGKCAKGPSTKGIF